MKKTKKKNKFQINDYDSLVHLRSKLHRHVHKQEEEFEPQFALLDSVFSIFGKGSEKKKTPVELLPGGNLVFQIVSGTLQNLLGRFAKSDRAKKIVTTTVTIGSVALTVFILRKVNKFFRKFAEGE
jgi:hypothetical protein